MKKKTYSIYEIAKLGLIISHHTKKPIKSVTRLRHLVQLAGHKPVVLTTGLTYQITEEDIKKINKSLIK